MVSGACLEDNVWCMSGSGWWCLMVSRASLVEYGGVLCMSGDV